VIEPSAALEAVDLGQMVSSVARSVAAAQVGLDLNSLRTTAALATSQFDLNGESVNLLALGLMPSFFQFAETVIDMKVSISMTEERSQETTTSESSSKSESKTDVDVSLGWFSASVSTETQAQSHPETKDAQPRVRPEAGVHPEGEASRVVPRDSTPSGCDPRLRGGRGWLGSPL